MNAFRHIALALLCSATTLATAAPAADGTGLVALDRATARRLVDPAAHTAPTVLALWSIECTHCKKNLALLSGLAKKHPSLRLITLATEPAEPAHAAPLDRLGVPGARYAYGTESPERLAFAIDPEWHGELPRTLFFDGRGGKVAISGVVDAARAEAALGLGATPAAAR